jgi:Flp pilus assembly pilin Flp
MKHDAMSRLVARLLRDDSGVTPLEYAVAAGIIMLTTLAVSRSVAGVLTSFVYRIHIVATLLMR